MPKRSSPNASTGIDISKIIARASKDKSLPDIYANHAQFTASKQEFIIDLFRIAPDPIDLQKLQANFLQRIIIPTAMAKGFVTAMAMGLEKFEEVTMTKLTILSLL